MAENGLVTPLSEALRARRRELGLSQRAAVEALGVDVSQAAYQAWESGRIEPGGRYLPAIFRFLGLQPAEAQALLLRDRMHRGGVEDDEARRWLEQTET